MNQWTDTKIKELLQYSSLAKMHSNAHVMAERYYNRKYMSVTLFIAILNSIGTLFEGTNMLLKQRYIGLSVVVLIVSAISVVLSQWLSSKDPSKLAANHAEMCKGYNRMSLTIDFELAKEPDERQPGVDFLTSIGKSMIDLSTGGTVIPEHLWNKACKENCIKSSELQNIHDVLSNQTDENQGQVQDTVVDMPGNTHLTSMPTAELWMNIDNDKFKKLSEFQQSRFRYF